MTTKTIDLEKTSASLDDLLALLNDDSEILLTKGDTALARLSAVVEHHEMPKQRIAGLHAGTTWVSDDFDEPLLQ